MSFWTDSNGGQLKGDADSAFVNKFQIIPDGTKSIAMIKDFNIKEFPGSKPFYQISWQIISDEFKGQTVRQKLAVFDDEPKKQDRAKNMLKLICNLCDWKPTHTDAPSEPDLQRMKDKICGIQIQEFSMVSAQGETIEGNWVSQVHPSSGFATEVGVKAVVEHKPASRVESALTRNSVMPDLNEDLPF